jgi:hypothetical protein
MSLNDSEITQGLLVISSLCLRNLGIYVQKKANYLDFLAAVPFTDDDLLLGGTKLRINCFAFFFRCFRYPNGFLLERKDDLGTILS